MVRKPRFDYTAVRVMAIAEIVELWHQELAAVGVSRGVLERELRIAVINLGHDWRVEGLVDPIPPDERLPPVTERLSRDEIRDFCVKQGGWPLPTFWFPPDPEEVKPVGRPSHMSAILKELERRAEAGELENTVSNEARVLKEWAVAQGYGDLQMKSIRNKIGERYRELKQRH